MKAIWTQRILGSITVFVFGAVSTSVLLMAQAGSAPVDQKPTQIEEKKAQVVVSQPAQLEELRNAIKRKGAKWIAGETSISRLAPDVRRGLLPVTPLVHVSPGEPLPAPPPPLPASFDWRSVRVGNRYVNSLLSKLAEDPAQRC